MEQWQEKDIWTAIAIVVVTTALTTLLAAMRIGI